MKTDEDGSKRGSPGACLRGLASLGFVSSAVWAAVNFAGDLKSYLGAIALCGFVVSCGTLAVLLLPGFVASFRKGFREFRKNLDDVSRGE
jgi:hypothetical protein